jgi:hypothetical protein
LANIATLITPGSPRSFIEQGSVFAWVSFERSQCPQVGQFSVIVNMLPVLNAVALLIQGLNLSTHGTGNTGRSLVVILVAAAVSLLCAAVSAVKRGRDLGYPALTTSLAILASLMLGPVFLVQIGRAHV